MTDAFHDQYRRLLAEAVRVLTSAARLSCTIQAGDATHERLADVAEFVSLTVAGAAANVGSIEQLLAGRPGSWEADHVRNLLVSTVGADEGYLLEHRTEPITVVVNVDDLMNDLGVWELYEEAEQELSRREDVVAHSSTTEVLSDDQEAMLDRLAALGARLEEQRAQEWAAYGDAFRANVHGAVAELMPTLAVPVEVIVNLGWQNSLGSGDSLGPDCLLWHWARDKTALPGSGICLEDYPVGAPVPQVERAAGRRPLDRVDAAGDHGAGVSRNEARAC